jgi:polysaccharide export outer membrane protein
VVVNKSDAPKVNYPLSAADVVQITVFQEDDLKSVLRVSNEGTITFPLIGVVSVAGKSAQEAGLAIRERLKGDYLINPQVTFTVMEYAKRRFTVLGQVQKPGSFDMPDQDSVTLLQALGMAGGYTRIADVTKITVVRHLPDGESKTFQVNAKRMAGGGDQAPFAIVPNDVVTVAESIF